MKITRGNLLLTPFFYIVTLRDEFILGPKTQNPTSVVLRVTFPLGLKVQLEIKLYLLGCKSLEHKSSGKDLKL